MRIPLNHYQNCRKKLVVKNLFLKIPNYI